ncbi:hypothetical protein BATDEDRAFT_91451 [Batrachochytrium dendrobatidis JAM81]|uniref:Transcription elongation factor n=1 Tax=Batrachochytrium dendrobatidis (strain JAM81 / FGSC 10211) TaxID=684364 RepID=F4PB34_BATDJ|nr:transcription elongation factor DST1 [Batrachochytrium dendrobatidis JAM81]EGF77653.1 hypothetical protein BATDEDRAFT_91451 [Batrachochytrium dendrobatidis JAM81]KAJ8323741.1 transcription elongation factor TFIIS [Batrachochytrium dendrobatidis]KAK5666338.1 transcription elongation factor TFIIS, variant 2 [Batrachochytrium dendrobatidis]|eukprot:XP_006681791.1 hypothetical protein BATDEDRAFT_91451 [Batrachochytrium dendrobatidis JAM81]
MDGPGLLITQIPKLKEHLTKALADNKEQIVIQLLTTLRTFKATTETLKSTRIGVFATELRKHPNATEKIKQLSRELVYKWKTDIGRVSMSESSESEKKQIDTPKTSTSSSVSTPTSTTHTAPRTLASDNVTLSSTRDKIRDGCAGMLYSSLASGTDAVASVVAKIASSIEKHIFAACECTDAKYKSRIRTLTSNLKLNASLRSQVLGGKISTDRFAMMTAEEMMSEERVLEVEKAKKNSMADAVSAANQEAETDMFRCGRCKQRKATYYQMQTRSADEPMTTFVTCCHCGNKWKFC